MHKYKAKKVTYKGINFDSKLEYQYFRYLELLKSSNVISRIDTQVKIEFILPTETVTDLENEELIQLLFKENWDDAIDLIKKIPIYLSPSLKLTSTAKLYTPVPYGNADGAWILSNKSESEFFFLKYQPPLLRIYRGKRIFSYYCDFLIDGKEYIDTKGVKTPIYNLKKKLIESLYGIEIKEVTRKDFKNLI